MNPQEYLNSLLAEIEAAKKRGAPGVFQFRMKMEDSVAVYARDYLNANTPYRIDFHKCPQCAFEWDVMIMF